MSASFSEEALTVSHVSSGKEFNEFARIEGLGPAMQQWLRESFHIHTVADLANLSAEVVLSRLRDEEKDFCRREIERWIQQAQDFVAHETPWHTFATFVVSLQSRQSGGQMEQRTTAYFLEADRKAIWSGIECNGVYELMLDQLKRNFQLELEVNVPMESESKIEFEPVAAHQSSSEAIALPNDELFESTTIPEPTIQPELLAEDQSESPEPPDLELEAGVESEVETGNVLESTEALIPEPETETPIEATETPVEAEVTEPLILKITQVKFWQRAEVKELIRKGARKGEPEAEEAEEEVEIVINMAKRSLLGMLHAARPFQIEVTFELTGTGAAELIRESLTYHIQCFIRNRDDQRGTSLENGAMGTFTNGETTCTRRLPEITSLQPGLYRLQVVTRLKDVHASLDLFELPFIQVM
jgi:hypothetical protein